MLIVLAVPSKKDSYYKKYFNDIVDFHVSYAKAILEGGDQVVILADKTSMPILKSRLPNDNLLLVNEQIDPWIRDVSPVITSDGKHIQFHYSGGLKKREAISLQNSFNRVLEKFNISSSVDKVNFVNDGGNFVYNRELGIVITTNKFLELNKIKNKSEAISLLQDIFGVEQIAIIPADDEKLGHVDGMCSIINNTILLASYEDDLDFRSSVLKELNVLKGITIKEVICPFSNKTASGGFASAYGVYVNCVMTENAIYVTVFNDPHDKTALRVIREIILTGGENCSNNSELKVIPVDATKVCDLGGSLRCLSWELTDGENAHKLIQAAKIQ